MATYSELVNAVQADLAYDEWRSANPNDTEARSAFVAGYQRGFNVGYEQGEFAGEDKARNK